MQIGGFEDITPGRAAEGASALQMRVWHIVESPVGTIPQDPTAGWGLRKRLGSKTTGDLRTEAAIGRAAIKKDREVREATVSITPNPSASNRYRVRISVTPIDGPPFTIDREV